MHLCEYSDVCNRSCDHNHNFEMAALTVMLFSVLAILISCLTALYSIQAMLGVWKKANVRNVLYSCCQKKKGRKLRARHVVFYCLDFLVDRNLLGNKLKMVVWPTNKNIFK